MLKYNPPKGLILTPSGMRGVVGDTINPEVIVRFCEAFGLWLHDRCNHIPKVLVGRDSRTTGKMIENLAIGALQSVGVKIINAGLVPTPVLLYGHKALECDGTVIISASHNPPKYNGMKCLSPIGTFLSREELNEINQYFLGEKTPKYVDWTQFYPIEVIGNLTDQYFDSMKKFVDIDLFNKQGKDIRRLKVIVDPGAGAGVGVTASFLESLGCEVIEINKKRNEDGSYPREFEPIKPHLTKLSKTIKELKADVGFAHDCDADRVGLIGPKGDVYPEDIILGLLVKYTLEKAKSGELNFDTNSASLKFDQFILVTNCASSLILDDLAESYSAKIFHTPVGERYLAEKMMDLEKDPNLKQALIFGGEGSCGGFMLPAFNNTRDGIFAAIKTCEMLLFTQQSIPSLVSEIPNYYSMREKVALTEKSAEEIMASLRHYLDEKGIEYYIIDRDVKIQGNKEWTLVHPSNTEPILRIITEASTKERAEELLKEMSNNIHLLEK